MQSSLGIAAVVLLPVAVASPSCGRALAADYYVDSGQRPGRLRRLRRPEADRHAASTERFSRDRCRRGGRRRRQRCLRDGRAPGEGPGRRRDRGTGASGAAPCRTGAGAVDASPAVTLG